MTATCVVGCKLPHGLSITLEDADGNPVQTIELKGSNASRIVGGHGLTNGVPKDLFEAWLKKNHALQFVRNGLVFMHDNAKSAESIAKERRNTRSGLEPIDPTAPNSGVKMDANETAKFRRQQAENPERNRQQVE